MTLSSFDAFKELMLAYKAEKHGVGVFAEGEGEGGGGLGGLGVEGVGGGAFAVGGGGLNIGSVADGAEGASFSVGVSVSPAKEREEEMLDGDERPDLDDGLVITRGPGGEEGP
jgi:ADP-ribosylation factor 2-binding protein